MMMDDSWELRQCKPTPLPRKPVNAAAAQRTVISEPEISARPVPLPRRLGPQSSQPSATTVIKNTMDVVEPEDTLDYDAIPSKNFATSNPKTGTINIFKLANQLEDPFDNEFEKSINEAEVSKISYEGTRNMQDEMSNLRTSFNKHAITISKLEDKDVDSEETDFDIQRQLSTSRSISISSDDADNSIAPTLSVHLVSPTSFGSNTKSSKLTGTQYMKKTVEKILSSPLPSFKEEDTVFEPDNGNNFTFVSSGSSHLPSSPSYHDSNVNFSLGKRITIPNARFQESSENQLKFNSIVSEQSLDLQPGSKVSRALGLSFVGLGSSQRKSIASPTESTDSFIGGFGEAGLILRKSFSNRASNASFDTSDVSELVQKKTHEYDDVALDEDGLVALIDRSIEKMAEPSNNSNSSSSLTSRNSVIAEFDPLLSKRVCPLASTDNIILDLNDEEHRYEFIDTEESNSEDSCSRNSNVSINPPLKTEVSTTNMNDVCPNGSSSLFPVNFKEHFEQMDTDSDTVDKNRNNRDTYEIVESPKTPNTDANNETDAEESRQSSSPNNGGGNPSSFFRRISSKFRRDEYSPNARPINSSRVGPVKSNFVPILRPDVAFATNLYTSPGLGRKEWVKKRVVLAQGKIGFCNDKSEVVGEIPLEKILTVAKKDDQRVVISMPTLKYFELSLTSWKSSSLTLAAKDENDRDKWMSKYMEVLSSDMPSLIGTQFERGGWCCMKEMLMGDWQPAWLILKNRTLYYGNLKNDNGRSYSQLDLRKARSITVGEKEDDHKCDWIDNSDVLTIDGISTIFYVQTESIKATSLWAKSLRTAACFNGTHFHEMQLTLDDVPVVVDKCIDFLYAHGTLAEGIYRQSGSNNRITQLLTEFEKDAWSVQINEKEYNAHDVAGTLKRFFRTRPAPLVTDELYEEWIAAAKISNTNDKNEEFQRLLTKLPSINYNIMKKLICHLYAVHELNEKNLMPLLNLAPIWGPTLMNVDGSAGVQSYERSCLEREVIKELIEGYYTLFRVAPAERAREKKMQDALENFHLGSMLRKRSGDMKIWVYRWEKDESTAVNVTLMPNTTAQGIMSEICSKTSVRNVDGLSLHEVICNSTIERPLHPFEKVVETVLRWSIWDIEERKDNYLILKKNLLYPQLLQYTTILRPLQADFKYADSKSKSFRKATFSFSDKMLKAYKDSKCKTELASWKIEDIVWYCGYDTKRVPPTKWLFTFVKKTYPFKRCKEELYFGNVICCANESELHKWIGALILGEHPEGLYPSIQV